RPQEGAGGSHVHEAYGGGGRLMLDFLEKAVLNTIGPAVTLLLAAVIGQRLSAYWTERQKRREFELSLANSFYSSYGEFFAVWKDWNRSLLSPAWSKYGSGVARIMKHDKTNRNR